MLNGLRNVLIFLPLVLLACQREAVSLKDRSEIPDAEFTRLRVEFESDEIPWFQANRIREIVAEHLLANRNQYEGFWVAATFVAPEDGGWQLLAAGDCVESQQAFWTLLNQSLNPQDKKILSAAIHVRCEDADTLEDTTINL